MCPVQEASAPDGQNFLFLDQLTADMDDRAPSSVLPLPVLSAAAVYFFYQIKYKYLQ